MESNPVIRPVRQESRAARIGNTGKRHNGIAVRYRR